MLVVFSDVELGAGGAGDDFPQSEYLAELCCAYGEEPFRQVPVTVVFNGDTFDLLKQPFRGEYPVHITGEVALGKLEPVLAAHRAFCRGLRRFLDHDGAPRKVCFLAGNHDLDLLFPEVQQAVREACGGDGGIGFPGLEHQVADVHLEHGMQADPLFAVDADRPFVEYDGERLLNVSWGTIALLEVAMPLLPVCYALDRLKPREELLERLPELRDLLLGAYWRYWTRDYWRDFFADADPLRKVSWTMLKEIAYRFGSKHADVEMGDRYQRRLAGSDGVRVCVVGHQHEPGWWSFGDRKVLRTGCMRNEFMLLGDDEPPRLIPKVYAELFVSGEHTVRSHLVEIEAPPPPSGYLPTHLRDVVPQVREALRSRDLDRTMERDRAARAHQEQSEARGSTPRSVGAASSSPAGFLRTLRETLGRSDG